jgi:predicted RNA-binding Zn ribbon-like protein
MVVRNEGGSLHDHDGDAPDDRSVDGMELVGGELCLDFVNTAAERAEGTPARDRLVTYRDLVRWGERTEALTEPEAERLRAAAEADAAGAGAALERARSLREAIYRVFRSWSLGEAPPAKDVSEVSAAAAEATAAQRLMAGPDGFEMDWPDTVDLDRAWWPAATSAVALLLSPDLPRVKECATDNCSWLFVDQSRNRSRRWCSMKDCGNRAKARRHYARRSGRGRSSAP